MNAELKKIRVCFIAPKAYPIFNPSVQKVFGGAEVDLYLLATELAKDERFEVSFVVGDYGQPDGEMREGVRLLKSLDFRQSVMTGAIKIWKAMKKADATVYMMKTASPGVPLTAYFCRRYKRRFVYKSANQGECDGSYVRRHPVLGHFFKRSLNEASQVIAQSRRDRDNLKRYLGLESIVIANGHRIPDVNETEKRFILWAGRSAAVKRPERFLTLAAAFPDERFVMICQRATGDGNYDDLRQQAGEIENLTFYEHVDFAEIDRFFGQAKVFVNTSDSEGFPNTFIQACKAGTAILSFKVNPDAFLTEYSCGLCGDGSQEAMASNLRILLADDRYLDLGQKGVSYVREQHRIETIVEQYKRLFAELIGGEV